jgi:hypothetical protein
MAFKKNHHMTFFEGHHTAFKESRRQVSRTPHRFLKEPTRGRASGKEGIPLLFFVKKDAAVFAEKRPPPTSQ